jgi:integrase
MSDEGASEELIADLVGHVKTSTTRTVYRHQLRPVITKGVARRIVRRDLGRAQVIASKVRAGF